MKMCCYRLLENRILHSFLFLHAIQVDDDRTGGEEKTSCIAIIAV